MLRKVVRESELILPRPPADAQRNLSLVSKPVKIVDEKEVDNRGRKVKMVLVRWTRDGIHEDVWEPEYHLRVTTPGYSRTLREVRTRSRIRGRIFSSGGEL